VTFLCLAIAPLARLCVQVFYDIGIRESKYGNNY
jgi:hypothetical protein